MTSRFNDIEEYLTELSRDATAINRRIVRLTNAYTPSSLTPTIRHLQVVATYRVHGEAEVVRLERYVGDVWGSMDRDESVLAKAKECHAKIEDTCRMLGLQVRAGIIEERTP